MSAKYKVGDQVTATIGRKDIPQRETHPAKVVYVTPALTAAGVQMYHVELLDLKGRPTFAVEEGDLAAAAPAPAPAPSPAPATPPVAPAAPAA